MPSSSAFPKPKQTIINASDKISETRDKTIYPFWLICLVFGIIIYLLVIIKNNEFI